MDEFKIYFEMGYNHIVAADAIDHILFIMVLAAVYQIEAWRKILILVTAFTIGHSITLALAMFDIVTFNHDLVEFLVQLTILITALLNFWEKPSENHLTVFDRTHQIRYVMAMVFGCIHGFAYSGSFRSLLFGLDESIVLPLFSFNVGIEVGQLLVLVVVIIVSIILVKGLKLSPRLWNIGLSSIAGLISIGIMIYKLSKIVTG